MIDLVIKNSKSVLTNADKIRNMTNKELANFIYGVSEGTTDCVACDDCCDDCSGAEEVCIPKIIDWLESGDGNGE